ncbi:MAG TPA: DNA-processing protein DprA [Vicinamibacterales bacterium]|jgi:DNA processing protein
MDLREAVTLSIVPFCRQPKAPDSRGSRRRPTDRELEIAADRALEAAARSGITPIVLGEACYPPLLAAIPDPPLVLWVLGNPACLAGPAVALVGSRAASPYGLEMASRLAAALAACGIVVVSGLARGIDAAAHQGALDTGRTIAVLGCGADVVYPAEHAALSRAIGERGALVSEFPPGTPPRAWHFPLRNRIISGLSLAIVVVEASEKSGSLITAGCALEQGREVMAVPGNALSGRNRGAHALLKDGAKIVETADDILEELHGVGHLTNLLGSGERHIKREHAADPILGVFQAGEPLGVDELAARTGWPAADLLVRLAELELSGFVQRLPGGRFVPLARTC